MQTLRDITQERERTPPKRKQKKPHTQKKTTYLHGTLLHLLVKPFTYDKVNSKCIKGSGNLKMFKRNNSLKCKSEET